MKTTGTIQRPLDTKFASLILLPAVILLYFASGCCSLMGTNCPDAPDVAKEMNPLFATRDFSQSMATMAKRKIQEKECLDEVMEAYMHLSAEGNSYISMVQLSVQAPSESDISKRAEQVLKTYKEFEQTCDLCMESETKKRINELVTTLEKAESAIPSEITELMASQKAKCAEALKLVISAMETEQPGQVLGFQKSESDTASQRAELMASRQAKIAEALKQAESAIAAEQAAMMASQKARLSQALEQARMAEASVSTNTDFSFNLGGFLSSIVDVLAKNTIEAIKMVQKTQQENKDRIISMLEEQKWQSWDNLN